MKTGKALVTPYGLVILLWLKFSWNTSSDACTEVQVYIHDSAGLERGNVNTEVRGEIKDRKVQSVIIT